MKRTANKVLCNANVLRYISFFCPNPSLNTHSCIKGFVGGTGFLGPLSSRATTEKNVGPDYGKFEGGFVMF